MDHEEPISGIAAATLDWGALVWALAAHRWALTPRVRAQLRGWEERARRVPDPGLRAAALAALERKRRNAEAVAVFALLAPRARRAAALRAIVALQVAVDYLDVLEEAGADAGGRPDDGGYLGALERESREAAAALPSYPALAPFAERAVERCKRGQRLTHAAAASGDPAPLRAWAESLNPPRHHFPHSNGGKIDDATLGGPGGYLWWEVAAGACSSVAAHALIAAAADPRVSAAEAELVDAAYFPPVGALTVLLDDLVDRAADAAAGEHSYIAYYEDDAAAADRLAFLVLRARAAIAPLRHRRLHEAILAGVVGYYTPAPRVLRCSFARNNRAKEQRKERGAVGGRLLAAAGPAARLVALVTGYADRD